MQKTKLWIHNLVLQNAFRTTRDALKAGQDCSKIHLSSPTWQISISFLCSGAPQFDLLKIFHRFCMHFHFFVRRFWQILLTFRQLSILNSAVPVVPKFLLNLLIISHRFSSATSYQKSSFLASGLKSASAGSRSVNNFICAPWRPTLSIYLPSADW